jgi:hypothetical protein
VTLAPSQLIHKVYFSAIVWMVKDYVVSCGRV